MNYALLWIDTLLIALLWTAFVAACLGRVGRRWLRNTLWCILAPLPLVPLGLFVFSTGVMRFEAGYERNWFVYALSLFLACGMGKAVIAWRASRREPGFPIAAASWSRGIIGCAFLAAIAIGYITLTNMDAALRARCAILGIDLESTYRALSPAIVSESENAAPLYLQAFDRLADDRETREVNNYPLGNSTGPFDPNEPATLAFLAQERSTIQLLRKAAAMPCRFDQDMQGPDLETMMPMLSHERLLASVLWLDAREELARGHPDIATEDAAAVLRMSRQFTPRPLIVSALAGIGIAAVGDKILDEALPAATSRADLASLPDGPLPSLRPAVQQSLRGEEAFGLVIYGNFPPKSMSALDASKGPVFTTAAMPSDLVFRAFFLDLDDYVRVMEHVRQWTTQPYYQISGSVKTLKNQPFTGMASLIAPAVVEILSTLNHQEAVDACATVAIAVTRYRLDHHGHLPASLTNLVPDYLDALPGDPFDGKPLRLAKKPDRWIIYSVGPDGIDNGGAPYNRRDKTGDLTFTLKLSTPANATRR